MKTLERPTVVTRPKAKRKAAPVRQVAPARPRARKKKAFRPVSAFVAIGLCVVSFVCSTLMARTLEASAEERARTARRETAALRDEASNQFEQMQMLVGPESVDLYARQVKWTYLGEQQVEEVVAP